MSEALVNGDSGKGPSPARLIALGTAYWSSMVLLAANRLGVFATLAGGARTAEEVAAACDAAPRSIEMLLNAAVAEGLLHKAGGRYRNSDVARSFLTPGEPAYLGDALRYSLDVYPLWGRLAEAVGSGGPPEPPETILGADPERTRNFVLAMHNRALGVASSLAESLDLAGRRRLLDVGGGPGTYSILLTNKTPGLRATVLDLAPVVEISREIIAEFGVGDRVGVWAGDYLESDLPGGNDVVLMSGVMHRETAETCRQLLAKAFEALEAGGLVVVSDVFFDDEEKTSPPFATLFALNMLLTSEHGSAHARTEMERWITEAGFSGIETRPFPPPMPHSMLLGLKP